MGHMGVYMVHVLLHVSGLILHGTFTTKFLGILYHKLSIIMLIRRSAGCFKCHYWIFGILGNYLSSPWVPYFGRYCENWQGFPPQFLCYQLEFCQILLTGERPYQWLKDATSFAFLSDKSTEKLEGKNLNFCYFSILAVWLTRSFIFVCKWGKWHHFCLICIYRNSMSARVASMENWKNSNIWTLISQCSYQIRRKTRWHLVGIDKTYIQ